MRCGIALLTLLTVLPLATVQAAAQEPAESEERVVLGRPAALQATPLQTREYIDVAAGVALYREASPDSEFVGTVDAPSALEIVERASDGWTRVLWRNRRAWVLEADGPAAGMLSRRLARLDSGDQGERLWQRALGQPISWRRTKIHGYEILTDLAPGERLWKSTQDMLGCLPDELARRLSHDLSPSSARGSRETESAPDRLLLFSSRSDYETFLEPDLERVGAGARGHAVDGLAALSLDQGQLNDSLALLAHELVHLLTTRWYPSRLPVWLEEGLAEEFAWSVAARGPCGSVGVFPETEVREVGSWIDPVTRRRTTETLAISSGKQRDVGCALPIWRNGEVSLSELLGLTPTYLRNHVNRPQFYVVAAAATRYLLDVGPSELRERFLAFVRAHQIVRLDLPAFADDVVRDDSGVQQLGDELLQWFEVSLAPLAIPCAAPGDGDAVGAGPEGG